MIDEHVDNNLSKLNLLS